MQVSENVDAAAACAMSESVKLPEAWGISARELCDHFAAWVRGELPVVGDVSADVRLPTTFQRNTMGIMIGDDETTGHLVGINASVRLERSGPLAFALNTWRTCLWGRSQIADKLWANTIGLTSRTGERFAAELISASGLYTRDDSQVGAVIVLMVHHIPRPLVPVVERRQQLGGDGFDDIQHALGKMEGRK